MKKICINCNAENIEEAYFCKKCGTKLPTLKEIETALKEEKEAADRKWKEEVEKTRMQNEALSQTESDSKGVAIYDKNKKSKGLVPSSKSDKNNIPTRAANPNRPTTGNKAKSTPKAEKKSSKSWLWILLIVIAAGAGFIAPKYMDGIQETIDSVKHKIGVEANKISQKIEDNKDPVENQGSAEGIFIDSRTGLTWQDDKDAGSIIRDWKEAKSYCNNLFLAGYNDWRLPHKTELEGIVDTSYTPAIKRGFQNVSPTHYWGSPIKVGSKFAHHIYFGEGGGTYYEGMDKLNSVRCVRED